MDGSHDVMNLDFELDDSDWLLRKWQPSNVASKIALKLRMKGFDALHEDFRLENSFP